MARSLFFLGLVAALACIASAAPKTSSAAPSQTSSAAAAPTPVTTGGYDEQGLPASIFPDYSSVTYSDTNELNDGQQYLDDQNAGKLPP